MGKYLCWPLLSALAIGCLVSSGCGPKVAVIEGKVTLDGKALPSGAISFEPTESGGKAFDGEIKDGNYRIEIPREDAVGKYVVRIMSLQPTGRMVSPGPPAPPGTMVEEIAEAIPAQYNANSKLQIDLSSAGPHNFELTTMSP